MDIKPLLSNPNKPENFPMSVRFAILGAGCIGQFHAHAVDGNEQAVLKTVFDSFESAQAF